MYARRPLVGLVLLFMAGVWCGLALEISAGRPAAAGAGLIALWALTRRLYAHDDARVVVPLLAASFFAGWGSAAAQMDERRAGPLAEWLAAGPVRAVVSGRVTDDPEPIEAAPAAADGRPSAPAWRFTLRADTARRRGDPAAIPEAVDVPVLVRWSSAPARGPARPAYGDRLSLGGVLYAGKRSASAVGSLGRRRLHLRASAYTTAWRPGGTGANPFVAWCYRQRSLVRDHLSAGIRDFPRHVSFLNALVLGYRQDLPRDTRDDFTATGTLHILAISGSHVMVIAGILIVVLQAAGVSRIRWVWALGPILIVYTVATGLSASAVRACIMAILLFLAPALRRRADLPTATAAAAVLILAADPSQLLDLGFLLSFAVVLGLVVLCPVMERPLRRRLEPDPARLPPEGRARALARALGRQLVALAVLTLAAWLVSTPLTAYFFQRFSLAALPANLILIPLAFLILLFASLSLWLGFAWIFLSELFNHANLFLVEALLRTLHIMARLPGGNLEVPRPPLAAILLYYALLAAAAWRLDAVQRRGH